jgi:GDPmannose 4,6-dehydratase
MKTALILGVSGQDGAYLSQLLLNKGYNVIGSSRDAQSNSFRNLELLGIFNDVEKVSISINDFRSVLQSINKFKPTEIYNLAGQSSVSLSFDQPVETFESIVLGNINILESIKFSDNSIKYYNAGSSEIFGNTNISVSEFSVLNPRSPYGVAKSAAFWQVKNYRETYNILASTGILFNHESPLRKSHFVTAKIIKSVCRIHYGSKEKLNLGNLDVWRDWGWAPEYVELMWKILQLETSDDFIIATGTTISLKDFIRYSFEYFNLNWEDHVVIDPLLFRPVDIERGISDITKAKKLLNWEPKIIGKLLITKLIECEINSKFY